MDIERAKIIDTTIRMVTLADRREWQELTNIFTEEVFSDYTALTGGTPSAVRAVELVGGWEQGFKAFSATQHIITNHEVERADDTAQVRAYFQATHCKADGALWILGGKYLFDLKKSGNEWRIAAITMTPIWARDEKNTYGT